MGVTVQEARARHRDIELYDEDGLQITLADDQASINVPYWESLDPNRLVEGIAKASNVIREETGWQLYDPQLEKVIDPVRDADEFARASAWASATRSTSRPSRKVTRSRMIASRCGDESSADADPLRIEARGASAASA